MKLADIGLIAFALGACAYGSHVRSEPSREEVMLVHELFLMHTYDPTATTESISYLPFGKTGVTAFSATAPSPMVKLDIEEVEDRPCVYRVISHVRNADEETYWTAHRFEIDANAIDFASAGVGSFQGLPQIKFTHQLHAMGDVLNDNPLEFVQDILPSQASPSNTMQARVERWLKKMSEFQRRYCNGR